MLVSNVFTVMGTYWLSLWSDAYSTSPSPSDVHAAFYMSIFALITFSEILSYAAIIILFELGAWRAARRLHNDFIRAIMRVSLSWFKIIPIGRVTNRFAGDMASIDNALPSLLRNLIDFLMLLLFRIAAISSIMPIFMVPSLFACVFGITLGEIYTRTAVIIKRLTSSAQSPIFSQFGDTLAGLPVVRARAGMAQAFRQELAAKLRVWSASAETNYNCNRWIAVRVDFVTALVSLTAGTIAVSKAGTIGAGLVGFSLSNANGLSQTILMLVRSMNDLEVEMQSVCINMPDKQRTRNLLTRLSFTVSKNTSNSNPKKRTTMFTQMKARLFLIPMTQKVLVSLFPSYGQELVRSSSVM